MGWSRGGLKAATRRSAPSREVVLPMSEINAAQSLVLPSPACSSPSPKRPGVIRAEFHRNGWEGSKGPITCPSALPHPRPHSLEGKSTVRKSSRGDLPQPNMLVL